jgi:hypothetical protein
MSPRSVALLLLFTPSVIGPSGCTGGTPPADQATGRPSEEGSVTVENLRLVREADGSRSVRGVVVNGSGEERSVQVRIALYDASNQRIAEVQVPVEHVGPGTQQGFSRTLDRDAVGASVRSILVF